MKVLEIKNNSGKTLTFKKQLWALYQDHYPVGSVERIKELTIMVIDKYDCPKSKQLSDALSAHFVEENPKKRKFEQNKAWKFNVAWKVLNSIIAISGFLIAIIK